MGAMYRDNSLIPTEAVRLAALGELARAPHRYADLAVAVRHFVQRLVGPSLDLLGPSLELLKIEGLIRPVEGLGFDDNALLELTDGGRAALLRLLSAPLKVQGSELNRLVVALKLRFLDLLPAGGRSDQLELLGDALAGERARLADLRANTDAASPLGAWLDLEIGQIDARIEWCERQRSRSGP
jgi:DNA-binding PadR family transcriptional regulator